MRVATYTRISTDEEHQPYSLEAQDVRLCAYIRSQDSWEWSRRYTDQMTGSVLERPDLQSGWLELGEDAEHLDHHPAGRTPRIKGLGWTGIQLDWSTGDHAWRWQRAASSALCPLRVHKCAPFATKPADRRALLY